MRGMFGIDCLSRPFGPGPMDYDRRLGTAPSMSGEHCWNISAFQQCPMNIAGISQPFRPGSVAMLGGLVGGIRLI
ncbi:hypothetical protein CLV48_106181 [Cecembia rubra]|uniref:Uncharacterized protein n=1 Tax=Cecembia rubra TaxID=1485585 RepID=A0A2P8E3A8_9BACT|nr:hypothetical protein CLV48_106181 [Cecembia rubra]